MKVLIVDDDPDVRAFLSDFMGGMGVVQVDAAQSGEEALARSIQAQ